MSTVLPPKPGHTITFALTPGIRTVKVNRLITDTTNMVIAANVKQASPVPMLQHASANRWDVKRKRMQHRMVPAHYVHGFGTSFRDTLVARYTPTLAEVVVYFPPNYHGMDHPTTDDWLRTRVNIWDALLFALGGPNGIGATVDSLT